MQLATVVGNQPWVCSVWFASDNDLNIYWFSSTTRRHSQEVNQNPKVAGAICLPQTPGGDARGLQFQGTAKELTDSGEIDKARAVYEDHIFPGKTIDALIANEQKPHRFYKIKVTQYVLFDTVNFPDESRQEWTPS